MIKPGVLLLALPRQCVIYTVASKGEKTLCGVFDDNSEILRAIMSKQVTTVFTTDGYARTYSTSKRKYTHCCKVQIRPDSYIYAQAAQGDNVPVDSVYVDG